MSKELKPDLCKEAYKQGDKIISKYSKHGDIDDALINMDKEITRLLAKVEQSGARHDASCHDLLGNIDKLTKSEANLKDQLELVMEQAQKNGHDAAEKTMTIDDLRTQLAAKEAENKVLCDGIATVNDACVKKTRKLQQRVVNLDDALSLSHTELTSIPDWPDTEHQHFVSETIEQALAQKAGG